MIKDINEEPGKGVTEVEQAEPAEGIPSAPASPKNQHLRSPDPKCISFTGRATKSEAERIKEALEVRKQGDKPYDIVRLVLDMLDHIEDDWMQTFKTKKKR